MTRLTGDWRGHGKLAIERGAPTVSREDFLDYMTFQKLMAPLFTEIFGPLVGLRDEWRAQGATHEELSFSAFTYRTHLQAGVGVSTGFIGDLGHDELIEETEDAIIFLDEYGRRSKLPKGFATLALLPLEHPVKTMDDWLRFKPWYEASEARFGKGWESIGPADAGGKRAPWSGRASPAGSIRTPAVDGRRRGLPGLLRTARAHPRHAEDAGGHRGAEYCDRVIERSVQVDMLSGPRGHGGQESGSLWPVQSRSGPSSVPTTGASGT
jgi:hypothetical protein